jgi:hypothetical protein
MIDDRHYWLALCCQSCCVWFGTMETLAPGAMFWLMGPHGGDFVDMRVPPETFTLVVWQHVGKRLVEEARQV